MPTLAEVLTYFTYSGTMSSAETTYAASGKYGVIKFTTSGVLNKSKDLADLFIVGGGRRSAAIKRWMAAVVVDIQLTYLITTASDRYREWRRGRFKW